MNGKSPFQCRTGLYGGSDVSCLSAVVYFQGKRPNIPQPSEPEPSRQGATRRVPTRLGLEQINIYKSNENLR